MKPTREVIRAALATDPILLALADVVKAADPTAKLDYVEAGGLKAGKRPWGKELDYQAKVRAMMEEKYGNTAWGLLSRRKVA